MPEEEIWLVQAGERLPLDDDPRIMRMGMVAEELVSRGHKVRWFSSRFDHARKRQRSARNEIEIRKSYLIHLLDGRSYSSNLSLNRIFHQIQVAKNLRTEAVKLPRPKLLLCAHPTPDLSCASAEIAQKLSCPFVVDIRDPWPDMFPGYFSPLKQLAIWPLVQFYRRLLRKAVNAPDAIFAVSQSMLDWGLSYAGRPPGKSDRVFYIGYQDDTKASLTEPAPCLQPIVGGETLRCVFVSTFGQSYDANAVVRAMRAISARGSKLVHCTFVGDGEQRAAAEELAKDLPNVTFTGWLGRSDLADLLNDAHVGILAVRGGISNYMLPNKLYEYLSYGLAVLNTLPNEAAAILAQGKAGETVATSNDKAIAEVLLNWSSRPELVNNLRESALKLFIERFKAQSIYTAYVDQLELLIKRDEKLYVANSF